MLAAGIGSIAAVTKEQCSMLSRALDEHGPLIDHRGVRIRLRVVSLVAFTGTWEHLDAPETTLLQTRVVGGPALAALDSYLRGETLPPWPRDFPLIQWAQAWAAAGGKYSIDDAQRELVRADLADADARGWLAIQPMYDEGPGSL
jgi:hypothetical protein